MDIYKCRSLTEKILNKLIADNKIIINFVENWSERISLWMYHNDYNENIDKFADYSQWRRQHSLTAFINILSKAIDRQKKACNKDEFALLWRAQNHQSKTIMATAWMNTQRLIVDKQQKITLAQAIKERPMPECMLAWIQTQDKETKQIIKNVSKK